MTNPRPKKPTGRKATRQETDAQKRKAVLAELRRMSTQELFDIAVRAGIYTRKGKLTRHYGGTA